MRAFIYGLGAVVLVPPLAYVTWLLVTPDYDGGRRPVGAIVVAAVLAIVLLAYVVRRATRR